MNQPQTNKRVEGVVTLLHNGKPCRKADFAAQKTLNSVVDTWLMDIKPAVRRGEKISLHLDFTAFLNCDETKGTPRGKKKGDHQKNHALNL